MIYSIVDIETDGLLKTITKVHCLCIHTFWPDGTTSTKTFRTSDKIVAFIQTANAMKDHMIIGHNFIRFDNPALKKVFGVNFTCAIMDSLAFSWILFPTREDHNLYNWGTDLGVEKPIIDDWSSDNIENIIRRCETDIQINVKLFQLQFDYLKELYDNNLDNIARYIGYIKFKMECAAEQEEVRWKLDKAKAEKNLEFLRGEIQPKLKKLSEAMPRNIKYKFVERPAKFLKANGEVSVAGDKWLLLLKEQGLPEHHTSSVKVVESDEVGNPASHQQLKAWLFSLGWAPDFYKYTHTKAGINKVPQINNQEGSAVCDSVQLLQAKEPALAELDSLTKLKHRIGLLEGFLSNVEEDGYLTAEIMGLTNTLRFQHTKIVNLPTVVKAYGGIVREVLIAPSDEYELCGSDMAGIEEATKHHYMYFYDPELVKKIRTKGFDPHLNLAKQAGLITEDDIVYYKTVDKMTTEARHELSKPDTELFEKIKDIRINKGKKTNFGAVYGAGPAKLALVAGITLKEATILHKAFWVINRAVKLVAQNCKVKTITGQMWLLNPVSGFWYTLRADKDRFSTLNQSTAVYCFDMQVRNVRKHGIKMCGQFHDEWVAPNLKTDRQKLKQIAEQAIVETNEQVQLNVQLGISIAFGQNYAEIH